MISCKVQLLWYNLGEDTGHNRVKRKAVFLKCNAAKLWIYRKDASSHRYPLKTPLWFTCDRVYESCAVIKPSLTSYIVPRELFRSPRLPLRASNPSVRIESHEPLFECLGQNTLVFCKGSGKLVRATGLRKSAPDWRITGTLLRIAVHAETCCSCSRNPREGYYVHFARSKLFNTICFFIEIEDSDVLFKTLTPILLSKK